jgi:rhodanese-related sulfurtransferase
MFRQTREITYRHTIEVLMNLLKNILLSLVGVFVLSACSDTVQGNLNALAAHDLAKAGKITLIDIRRPDEWRQTGVGEGVKKIDMQHPQGMQGFAQEVAQAVGQDIHSPIVLICRTGSRTSRLVPVLTEMGFTNVRQVPEGMLGSRHGPGWIARGLPTESCDC